MSKSERVPVFVGEDRLSVMVMIARERDDGGIDAYQDQDY